MISRSTRSRDERAFSTAQHQAVPDPVPVVLGKDIKNAVLMQVAKQIKIKMKKAKA